MAPVYAINKGRMVFCSGLRILRKIAHKSVDIVKEGPGIAGEIPQIGGHSKLQQFVAPCVLPTAI